MINCDQFILSCLASNKWSYHFNQLDQASGFIIMSHSDDDMYFFLLPIYLNIELN